MAGQPIDPITLQVLNGALQTIAEEMGHVLYRMSFSSIIREFAGSRRRIVRH